MMDPIFIIAIVFLVVGGAFAGYVVYHKTTVIRPLEISEHDEVMECYLMTGDSDYLIRVAVADMGALEKFILEQLTPISGIEKIRSSFALKQVRYKTALPLPK